MVFSAAVGASAGTCFWRSACGGALCVVAACLLFPWLGSGSLANGDDAVYAWAARRMLEEGSWLTYRWHGAALFSWYPPLHFALVRVSLMAFGESEFAYRLPAALAAFASVLLTADIALRVTQSRVAAVLAGGALLASVTFYLASRSVCLDMTFLLWALLAYDAYLRAQDQPWRHWLLGLFCGLAYLTKSLFAAFIVLPVVLDVLLFRRALLRERALYGAALVFLCMAGLWHVSLWAHGQPIVPAYGQRVLSGLIGNFGFAQMIARVVEMEGVAMALWAAGFVFLVVRSRNSPDARFFVLTVLSGLLILLATRTTLPHYMLTLFPPVALGAGWVLSLLLEKRPIYLPLAGCALAVVFAANNLTLFVDPDLSPGAREVALMARKAGPQGRVLFFRDYSAAFDFYLNRSTLLMTESKHAYDLYVAHPAMRDGPGIALLAPEQVVARLSEPGMMVATTLIFEGDLVRYLDQLPEQARASLRREHAGGYVLYASASQRSAALLAPGRNVHDD